MKVMLLAAGEGKRMRPWTNNLPKPLLKVGQESLIERHIRKLAEAGFSEIIINIAYLGQLIEQEVATGEKWQVNIQYSKESVGALETGGGIVKALPLLGDSPFLLISADIWTEYDYHLLPTSIDRLGHLVLVDNPSYHKQGDFGMIDNQLTLSPSDYTFGNVAILHPKLFANLPEKRHKLSSTLTKAIQKGDMTGEYYDGAWFNVGSHEQWCQANDYAASLGG